MPDDEPIEVLLFPPVAADAAALSPITGMLAAAGVRARLVPFPDARAWPNATRPSFAELADVVADGVRRPVTLVALAAGAYVATELLLRHPELVRSVIYVGGGFAAEADPVLRRADAVRAQATRDGMTSALVEETIPRWFSPSAIAANAPAVRAARERLERMPPDDWRALWLAIAERAAVPDEVASGWTTPVSLVAPTDDATRSPALLTAMHRRLPGSRYVELPGPHMIALERPEAVVEAVLDHLAWTRERR